MKVVVTKTDDRGNIDMVDLEEKVEMHSENLAALMITYPSTHGVFESSIKKITQAYSRPWGTGLYGWCQYECSGRINKSGNYWS